MENMQANLYINLRRSRDCPWVSVAAGGRRPAGLLRLFVCVIALHHLLIFGEVLRCPHKRTVTITKVYIARNTIHVEIIRFHTN